MTNENFLNTIEKAFKVALNMSNSQSNMVKKPLHGAIAMDIASRLGDDYLVKSQGYGEDREGTMDGRYYDKKVDITVFKDEKPIAGIAVKFVMQNYSQNSCNYFENMLGETANIRCGNHPYFQVFIIFDRLPYYNDKKEIAKWEQVTDHNIEKYIRLSNDNTDVFYHTPNKTLIYIVHVPDIDVKTKEGYLISYRSSPFHVTLSAKFDTVLHGPAVIINDYEVFASKVYHAILAL